MFKNIYLDIKNNILYHLHFVQKNLDFNRIWLNLLRQKLDLLIITDIF